MRLKNRLLCIWAYFPFFSLTDDLGFLEPSSNLAQAHEYYFSLINILLGEKSIQFISVPIKQPNKNITLFRMRKLSDMDVFSISNVKNVQLEHDYKIHFDSLEKDEKNIEKEELLRKLNEQTSRIETSYNKINAFTTIILAIIPIAITFIDKDVIYSFSRIGWIVFILMMYTYVNLCAWIFQAINVRNFSFSSFKELKESEEKAKEQNWQIYYDWQQMRRKADMYVSFVKYTKVWIIAVIVMTIVFSLGYPFSNSNIKNVASNQVYTFHGEMIQESYEESAITWNTLLVELNSDEYSTVFVLYNEADVDYIAEQFENFNHQKFIWMMDAALEKSEIKIILEK